MLWRVDDEIDGTATSCCAAGDELQLDLLVLSTR